MPSMQEDKSNLLTRSLKASAFLGGGATLFACVYAGYANAARYGVGLGWMIVNLALWRAGLREILHERRPLQSSVFLLGKVMWLGVFLFLAWALGLQKISFFVAFMLGLNTPFLVVFLKAVGRQISQSAGFSKQAAPEVTLNPDPSEDGPEDSA